MALAVGLFVLLFVMLFVLLVGWVVLRTLTRGLLMSNLGHALKVARTCAGEAGRCVSLGSISVYVFGRNDPIPILEDQVETCRRRFESLLGKTVDPEHPLRIFSFGKRMAFEGFCRRSLLNPGNLDGLFIPWSARTIIMTSEYPAYRLPDPERVARILLSHFHLEAFRKCPTPLWLQSGIANLIACGDDEAERARLDRRVMPSLVRRNALGAANLFHANPRELMRLLRNWQAFDNFSKYQQLTAQSCSVTEYLCGHQASHDQRERFRGFLTDLKPNTVQDAVFERHFGYGFDILLERWRACVLERGVGIHQPPPEPIRHAILGSLVPIIADRAANPTDRVQAIRDLGRTGYVVGADTLIDLVRTDDENIRAEAIRSLEAISGLPLGDDAERWADEWLAGLPKGFIGVAQAIG